jgi:N-acetyl-anhydromuramyl-L-alanine amidase AmpD
MSGFFKGTIAEFRNPSRDKSSHYLVAADGSIALAVPELLRAHHAGSRRFNAESIGIELEDGGVEGYLDDPQWATAQLYDATARLVACLANRYVIPIDRKFILGHSDVAPGKRDPGQYWDWDRFLDLVRSMVKTCQ